MLRKSSRHPLYVGGVSVVCHIATDLQPTVFQGQIAHRLGLTPRNVVADHVSWFLGRQKGWWCKEELWLSFGPAELPVEVWFPVRRVTDGWEWRCDFPKWNVLGMTGVLERRLLCLTSEQVFVFERL